MKNSPWSNSMGVRLDIFTLGGAWIRQPVNPLPRKLQKVKTLLIRRPGHAR
jgi:hypothetical protein